MKAIAIIVLILLVVAGCTEGNQSEMEGTIENEEGFEMATFAGGCFWCIEAPFEGIDGVNSVLSGYSGGKEKKPTYSQVSSGNTSHTESVQITYNPDIISYSELLELFWKQFDPTDAGGSFYDRGAQYRSAIFYHSNEQRMIAEKSKMELDKSGKFDKPIVTEIVKLKSFYPAEEYHQDYYKKETAHYKRYRKGSGRDEYINSIWGDWRGSEYKKPSTEIIKAKLNDKQYMVTQEDETEPAFNNAYWNNQEIGIYVDIVSGEPLFSSRDKFKSGSGWPSFTKPIDVRYINKVIDNSFGMQRVEVRSKIGDSHLGHVFNDGPESTNLRYCMNSASLRFIHKDEMVDNGYGAYLWLVE